MALNADNVSPASTNSSSTSTNTTAEAVSVIELHHRNATTTEEDIGRTEWNTNSDSICIIY
ncbi:hypothetical protein GQX74_003580 [Glossina fuscipes]|nr:hypothetical protein GQX74_003580 [Glossina fuscipes]